MDPNETLQIMRELSRRTETTGGCPGDNDMLVDAAYKFSELFDALDRWLSDGGFLPDEWAGKEKV